jgi:hypothetical protein
VIVNLAAACRDPARHPISAVLDITRASQHLRLRHRRTPAAEAVALAIALPLVERPAGQSLEQLDVRRVRLEQRGPLLLRLLGTSVAAALQPVDQWLPACAGLRGRLAGPVLTHT